MSALWPDAVVEEANLAYNVSAVRKALGDAQEGEQFIQTVPTRGYRFVAPVREVSSEPAAALRPRPTRAWAIGGIAFAAGGLLVWILMTPARRFDRAARPVVRFDMPVVTLLRHVGPPAVSPDGTQIAYVSAGAEGQQVFVRALDSVNAVPLAGTGAARLPFFSADGAALGFFADEWLRKVELATGRITTLCPVARLPRGATWGPDDRIYFTPAPYSGISVVSANGGQPETLTEVAPEEVAHGWPELLPDGRHLLFTRWDSEVVDDGRIEALELGTRERRTVLEGGYGARYVPTGHLLYVRRNALLAVPFDAKGVRTSGTPVRVMEGISTYPFLGQARFSVSATGTLAYFAGPTVTPRTSMVWIDLPERKRQTLEAPPGLYLDPVLSPDGRRLAVAPLFGSHQDVWVGDLMRGTWTRLTVNPRFDSSPVWRPDDPNAVVFSAGRGGARVADLYSVPADASRPPELVYESPHAKYAQSSSAAAGLVAFTEVRPETKADVWLLQLGGGGRPSARPLLQTRFWESAPALSPDGRWVAYESDESGASEIYVRPVSGDGGKWQVSSGGGDRPRWVRDGRQVVYRRGKDMMAAAVTAGASVTVERPRVLFGGEFEAGGFLTANYDLTPDARRFLMIEPVSDAEATPSRLVVVDNWFAELRQKLGR